MSGRDVSVCGDPCRTAVETIANAGLDAWYGVRSHAEAQGAIDTDPRHRAELDAWRVPEVEASVLRSRADTGRDTGSDTGSHSNADASTGHDDTVTLTVEGMRCAGCAWLVERLLAAVPGVDAATVDFPLRRAEVRFDTRAVRLHTLLETLARAGYRAAPYTVHAEEAAIESERRARLRGLGISALFGMQVMLLSIALYASDYYASMEAGGGMDPRFEQLFRWLAMMLTVPVVAWPGRTFFTGAVAALRGRRLTMDVPVALGLAIAFFGSVFATVSGEGEVWFDSVVMFVTLLSAARYLELLARRRATASIRALARSAPLVASRVRESRTGDEEAAIGAEDRDGGEAKNGEQAGTAQAVRRAERRAENTIGVEDGTECGGDAETEQIPAAALRPGDRVRVRPGEVVPADGIVRSGHSAFDESLLTGESMPVARSAGSRVLAGSVNGFGVVEVEVTSTGDATVLGAVLNRAEQAARERPAIAQLADRAAAWFIGGVLVLATGVAIGWMVHDPARVIPVLVSVLVVTCPCALSLATPAAMTAALGALARAGLVVTRANAVERLALATHCLADKTGTLTEGRFRLHSITTFTRHSRSYCLALAASLERFATHPIAATLVEAAPEESAVRHVEAPDTRAGGVSGRIDGARYAVGSPDFVARTFDLEPGVFGGTDDSGEASQWFRPDGAMPENIEPAAYGGTSVAEPETSLAAGELHRESCAEHDHEGGTHVLLAREGVLLARFVLADTLRADAAALVQGLRRRGIETTIASGDSAAAVECAARDLGIARHLARLSPEDKLEEAARLAAAGERVLMLGDGVNDVPALAGAHVSVAMGRGAAAAAARADAVLIGGNPGRLLAALDIARRARRIVKQNLAWALGYNLVALPLAASGAVPPWAAAIGMSLSSLAVAGNALRLGRGSDPAGR